MDIIIYSKLSVSVPVTPSVLKNLMRVLESHYKTNTYKEKTKGVLRERAKCIEIETADEPLSTRPVYILR